MEWIKAGERCLEKRIDTLVIVYMSVQALYSELCQHVRVVKLRRVADHDPLSLPELESLLGEETKTRVTAVLLDDVANVKGSWLLIQATPPPPRLSDNNQVSLLLLRSCQIGWHIIWISSASLRLILCSAINGRRSLCNGSTSQLLSLGFCLLDFLSPLQTLFSGIHTTSSSSPRFVRSQGVTDGSW